MTTLAYLRRSTCRIGRYRLPCPIRFKCSCLMFNFTLRVNCVYRISVDCNAHRWPNQWKTSGQLMNHVTHAQCSCHPCNMLCCHLVDHSIARLTIWTAKVKTKKTTETNFSLKLNANAKTELFTKNVSMQINDKFYSMSWAFIAVCTIRPVDI